MGAVVNLYHCHLRGHSLPLLHVGPCQLLFFSEDHIICQMFSLSSSRLMIAVNKIRFEVSWSSQCYIHIG